MNYGYEINRRPKHLGHGWSLRLLKDGEEVGGGIYPNSEAGYIQAIDEGLDWIDWMENCGHEIPE